MPRPSRDGRAAPAPARTPPMPTRTPSPARPAAPVPGGFQGAPPLLAPRCQGDGSGLPASWPPLLVNPRLLRQPLRLQLRHLVALRQLAPPTHQPQPRQRVDDVQQRAALFLLVTFLHLRAHPPELR